jgi:hypothetical protein
MFDIYANDVDKITQTMQGYFDTGDFEGICGYGNKVQRMIDNLDMDEECLARMKNICQNAHEYVTNF